MAIRGHEYSFHVDSKDADDESASDKESSGSPVRKISSRKDQGHGDIEEILHGPIDVEHPRWDETFKNDIHKWIERLHEDSRGFEIGTFNYSILPTLMKEQSVKFIQQALEAVCKDRSIALGIKAHLMDDLMFRYRESIVHVDFLLKIERDGTPMTFNHYLNDNLQNCRQKRVTSTVTPMIVSSLPNVKAADYHLVTGPMAPMNLLSASWVNSLSNEKPAEIAGEDPGTQQKRRRLGKEIDDLEAGKKVLSS
ncbi:Dynamin [Penicillium angulare]|uniref:Dynamin n=1 Tax=Penicillium angulare TaxID=116970 RepID=UPI002541E522|nr:Dynamin [Penicillium angulare]KAJ5289198.1 Dynamin [Penicillium angulare]